MKQWIQKIAVYALAAAAACFCVACASAQPSGSASESIQQTTSQELTYDKQNHTPMHQSGYTFQIIDVTSGEESATIFFTMSPLDSKQAAENLTITTSTGDCTASVLKYDEQNKQALFECSVDMNASEKMKILVQDDGLHATVPVTVLADKSVQTDTPLTSATGKKGTLNEIRLNTSTITFQYTLPGYLEAQNEWDADWTEYVHGTPDVTVTFADGSTKKLELQELHGDLEPEVMKTYTHYFGLADAIDLENAETLTVNGTDYTLHRKNCRKTYLYSDIITCYNYTQ